MSHTSTGTNHCLGANPVTTSKGPISFHAWRKPVAVGQFRRYLTIGKSGDLANVLGICSDIASGTTNDVSAYVSSSTTSSQKLGGAITSGAWNSLGASFSSNNTQTAYLNGSRGNSGGGGVTPAALGNTYSGGRSTDSGSSDNGEKAHDSIFNRVLTDLEYAYLGLGGNARWLVPVRYWEYRATELATVTDEMGNENLTVTGETAGASDPVLATYWTAVPLGNQGWTQGSAIPSVDLTTKLDKVAANVDYTCSLIQLGTPGTATTASSAGTSSNQITVASATGFTEGAYCSVTNSTTPVFILKISGTTLLLGSFLTWASGDNVYPIPVSAKTFTFYSSGNTLSGTPGAGDVGTYNNLAVIAKNNTTATLVAVSPLFNVTIAASGAAPSFTAGPTLNSTQTDGWTFGSTPSASATWHIGAYIKGSAVPSVANLKGGAGTGFIAHFSKAVTAADTLSVTGLASVGLPAVIADVHMLLTNGSGDSAIVSFTALLVKPATGKQFVAAANLVTISAITKANPCAITTSGSHGLATGYWVHVFGAGGMVELNATRGPLAANFAPNQGTFTTCTVVDGTHLTLDGIDSTAFTTFTSGGRVSWGFSTDVNASTAIANGDIRILDAVTLEDGIQVVGTSDGAVSLPTTPTRRQTYTVDSYSVSGNVLIGSGTQYINDIVPDPPDGVPLPVIFLPANQSTVSVNLSARAIDPQNDTVAVSISGLPAGLSVSGTNPSLLVGATSGNSFTQVTYTYTNKSGDSVSQSENIVIGSVTLPNLAGKTQQDIDTLLAALYLSASYGAADDPNPLGPATAGLAIGQSIQPGLVLPNTVIGITLSTGLPSGTVVTPPTAPTVKSPQLLYEETANTVNNYRQDESFGAIVLAANDAAGQIYRIGRISAAARVTGLQIANQANPTGSIYRIGVALPNGGGLVVPGSDSILVPSLSLDSARTTWTDVYFPAIVGQAGSIVNVGKRIWELLGFTQDPSPATKDLYYDIILTAVSPGQAGGAVNVRVTGRLITSLRVP